MTQSEWNIPLADSDNPWVRCMPSEETQRVMDECAASRKQKLRLEVQRAKAKLAKAERALRAQL